VQIHGPVGTGGGKGEKEQERAHGRGGLNACLAVNSSKVPRIVCSHAASLRFLFLLAATSAFACSVPVFRYALGALGGGCVSCDGAGMGRRCRRTSIVTRADGAENRAAAAEVIAQRRGDLVCPFRRRMWACWWIRQRGSRSLNGSVRAKARCGCFWRAGDKAKDDEALKFLDERIDYLGGVMEPAEARRAGHQKRPRLDSGRWFAARVLDAESETR
jgi:hypothetical protein